MAEKSQHATSAANLKFLHYKRQILFRNFKWRSGTGNYKVTSARDFSKFVKGRR
jgi:hypothetical protein